MRSIARPIARPLAIGVAAAVLGLSLTACGEDDPKATDGASESSAGSSSGASEGADGSDGAVGAATDGATDGATPQSADSELCTALADIIEVVDPIEDKPNRSQWAEIQDVYAALGEVELPADVSDRQREGRDASVKAITSLSWAEAEKAFDDASGQVPGLTAEQNQMAAEFFTWAGQQCPSVLGTADAEASSVTTQ